MVSVLVILCTLIGASPPTATEPTIIWRDLRRTIGDSVNTLEIRQPDQQSNGADSNTADNDTNQQKMSILRGHSFSRTTALRLGQPLINTILVVDTHELDFIQPQHLAVIS